MNIYKQIRVFALLSGLVVTAILPANSLPKEWLLVQEEDTFRKMYVRISELAARVEVPSMGFVILAKAPDWTVHIFRNDDKLEWKGAMEDFTGGQLANPYVDPSAKKREPAPPPANVENKDICGLPGKLYRTKFASYSCADEIKVDSKIVRLFNRLHSTPLLPSVPLTISSIRRQVRVKRQDGKDPNWIRSDYMNDLRTGEVIILNTSKVVKIPYNAKDFEPPKGYKRMRDPIEVSYSSSKKDELNDLINNVGFVGKVDKAQGKAHAH